MPDAVTTYIALGSNLGDRRALLDEAVARLRLQPDRGDKRFIVSRDRSGRRPRCTGKYLNAAACLNTTLDARQLLGVLQAIESQLGRVRAERFGPRTIDLDLLLYGSELVQSDELTVPHPRMHERAFVLEPLAEIAPLAVHPVRGSTVKDLLERLRQPTTSRRELAGQNAVVTGSTSGIGRAIALALADAGANVIVHGRRSQERADSVAAECRGKQVKAQGFLADLRDENAAAKFVERVWQGCATLDIWVHCAGADTLTGEAAKWPFERKLQELWAVDVRATIQLSRAVGILMKRQGHGVILTMGWDQAETGIGRRQRPVVRGRQRGGDGVHEEPGNRVGPGGTRQLPGPRVDSHAWGEGAADAWQKRVLAETPLARWGTPDDVAQAARWLVSPAAQFITGQIVRINGGAVCC